MARIKELPEGLKVADLIKGAEGVGGLVTMLAVGHLQPFACLLGRSLICDVPLSCLQRPV